MVSRALEAATALALEGISTRVLDVGTIKPLNREAVIRYAGEVGAIITAEEQSAIGGLGSAVVESLPGIAHAPVEFVGVPDSFSTSAQGYDELLARYGLTTNAIAEAVKAILKGAKK
jgi:transketolase